MMSLVIISALSITFNALGANVIMRASTNSLGAQAASSSLGQDISADGRYVAFFSYADNLVSDDTNNRADVFLKDIQTGLIQRVSTSSSGAQTSGSNGFPSISADGRFVAFSSYAANLVDGDTNGFNDVFIKDTLTGLTTRVSTDSNGAQAIGGNSVSPDISADGLSVAFSSLATNLVSGDTNNAEDVFVKNMTTGVMLRASTDSSGAQTTTGGNSDPAISADGRYVAFTSNSPNLVTGDTNNVVDIFVKDILTGSTTRVSTKSSGAQGANGYSNASISADGRFVAFDGYGLVSGQTNNLSSVYLKDTVTGIVRDMSTNSSGAQATGGASWSSSITPDGRYVAFESDAKNLVTGDTNNQRDIFVKDSQTNVTTRVSSGSAGEQANAICVRPTISADGRIIAFASDASNLIIGDTNNGTDVFISDINAGNGVCTGAKPPLSLIKNRSYWASYGDYQGLQLSVDYRVDSLYSDISDLYIVNSISNYGVSCTSTLPIGMGYIPAGGSRPFTLKYHLQPGLILFPTSTFATAHDGCGNLFTYP